MCQVRALMPGVRVQTTKMIDTPIPNHKVVSREKRQGMTDEFEMEHYSEVTFTSGFSRRAFLQAGAMAITATGLASGE